MSIYRSDNPIADFDRWDAGLNKMLERLPLCSECENPIQDEHCYEFNGELICEDCLHTNHRKHTEDYTE